MTGEVITFMSYNPFPDVRTSLLCFQMIFLERTIELRFEILSVDVCNVSQVSFEKTYYTFVEEVDKLLWEKLTEKAFAFVGK